MPATPADPPRRAPRRDQRNPRKEWSALDTPHGFERCVRATLRELYGYVALLTGRDRREAERLVRDVYRSLFRAASAGHVESVTLGALRSAARRTWLEEHLVELATTDEVSRAPVSTIAELSPLERAVLVLRHVNGMSTDRAATELGRPEREIVAVGAHAVRRLRGTDDTSGAWLRAYLGPSVTPTAGLVDRIVRHLGEPEPATSGEETARTADEAGGATTAPVDELVDGPAEEPVEEAPAETDAPADGGAPETTELLAIDRPTVEVPTIVTTTAATDAAPIGPPTPVELPDRDDVEPGRPRWALVIGVLLLVGLVVGLVWLALRGDAGDTVVSSPESSANAAEPGTEGDLAGTAPDATDPGVVGSAASAITPTTISGTPSITPSITPSGTTSATAASVPAGPIELGFDPVCEARTGAEPGPVSWGDTFGPLGPEPVLTVTLPESVDIAVDPERTDAVPTAVLRPDGLVVAVQPGGGHRTTMTIVARVGLDGTVAWVRCIDDLVRIGSAPDAGVDLAIRPAGDGGTWSSLSVVDGSDGDPLDAVQGGGLDSPSPSPDDDGPTLGYSYDSDLRRSVIAGLDDGRVLWTAPDVVLPDGDAFRAIAVDDTVLAQSCVRTDRGTDCDAGELRAYDLETGELLWSRSGAHRVAASGDGFALLGDGSVWELVDVRSGGVTDGQRWDAPGTFDVGDDPDVGFVVRDGGALLVARPGTVSVWLPRGAGGDAVDVAIP